MMEEYGDEAAEAGHALQMADDILGDELAAHQVSFLSLRGRLAA